jgi:hypothetical protein
MSKPFDAEKYRSRRRDPEETKAEAKAEKFAKMPLHWTRVAAVAIR